MLSKQLLFIIASYLVKSVLAFDASSNTNVAVYWGQNSAGSQQRLRSYCETDSVDIVILSFLYSYPDNLQLNFANACGDTFTDGLLHCSTIGDDIKTCQNAGKKVLLSLGGATGAYGFNSDSEATSFAKALWNKLGGGSDNERPFDDAIVDGFDFDIENNNQVGYVALGKALRTYFEQDTSKKYYLSASPQCPYPDASIGNLLSEVDIDFAFIQFYNNYCKLGSSFNWNTWVDYADNTSPNKDIKLYVGLPGGSSAAGSGYSDAATVKQYLDDIRSGSHFGGISLWDASAAWSNTANDENYAEQMKDILDNSSTSSSSSTISSTAKTSIAARESSFTSTTFITSTISTASTTSTVSITSDTIKETVPDSRSSTYYPETISSASSDVKQILTVVETPTTLETVTRTSTRVIISTLRSSPIQNFVSVSYAQDGRYDNSKFDNGQWKGN